MRALAGAGRGGEGAHFVQYPVGDGRECGEGAEADEDFDGWMVGPHAIFSRPHYETHASQMWGTHITSGGGNSSI